MQLNNNSIIVACPLCKHKSVQVVTDGGNQMMQCLHCGYSTSDLFKEGSSEMNTLDENMKKWSKTVNGYVWIPAILNLAAGLIYPFEDEKTKNMKWSFSKLIDIPEEEQQNYPKEDGEFYSKRYDVENQLIFDNFSEALKEVQTDYIKENLEKENGETEEK